MVSFGGYIMNLQIDTVDDVLATKEQIDTITIIYDIVGDNNV